MSVVERTDHEMPERPSPKRFVDPSPVQGQWSWRDSMELAHRNELIDAYYRTVDTERFDRFRDVFRDDITYRYPGEPVMHGVEDVLEFFRERRTHSNSTHQVHRRLADDEVSVCEGSIEAEADDGSRVTADFVGVFEFDELIAEVRVYVRR